ncbi:hypothetical protein HK405_005962 [Cladochytrium tenue]|nr:hypothetical protein HK405_005962 [Cladochytrium tenue]
MDSTIVASGAAPLPDAKAPPPDTLDVPSSSASASCSTLTEPPSTVRTPSDAAASEPSAPGAFLKPPVASAPAAPSSSVVSVASSMPGGAAATSLSSAAAAAAAAAARGAGQHDLAPLLAESRDAKRLILSLNKDITALKRHGNPSFADIQALAERTWRANLAYEAQVARLEREKQSLGRLIDATWAQFDTLIRPLWRIDDELVPAYDALTGLLAQLEDLATRQHSAAADTVLAAVPAEDVAFEARDRDQELWRIQDALHEVEDRHVVGGKFYGVAEAARLRATAGAAAASSARVPGGQALVANLLARCYRLVRKVQEAEPAVHPGLYALQLKLEDVVSALRALRVGLDAGMLVDPVELRMLQEQVDKIDRARVDGRFVLATADGQDQSIPEGQAVLSELLNDAYDLIHECLVEVDAQAGDGNAASEEQGSTIAAGLAAVTERVASVRDALLGLSFATGDRRAGHVAVAAASSTATAAGDDTAAEAEKDAAAATTAARREAGGVTGLAGAGPALHGLADALSSGFSALRATVATTAARLDAPRARLALALRSGLSALGSVVTGSDGSTGANAARFDDPALAAVRARLLALRDALLASRNRRNMELTESWARESEADAQRRTATAGTDEADGFVDVAAAEPDDDDEPAMRWRREWARARGSGGAAGTAGAAGRLDVRTQLAELDDIDGLRDDWGNFVGEDGEAAGSEADQAALRALLEECYCLAYELLG